MPDFGLQPNIRGKGKVDSGTILHCLPMTKQIRTLSAGIPHRITQCGSRREGVFFAIEYRGAYLAWLREFCGRFEVEILGPRLINSYVHLRAAPASDGVCSAWLNSCICVSSSASTACRTGDAISEEGGFFFAFGRCLPLGGGKLGRAE
jgi:hypothetical protein